MPSTSGIIASWDTARVIVVLKQNLDNNLHNLETLVVKTEANQPPTVNTRLNVPRGCPLKISRASIPLSASVTAI